VDLQEYLTRLESSRELYRYTKSVKSADEAAKLAAKHKKALLFERVEGAPWPIVTNLLGSERRTAWALGVDNLQILGQRAHRLFDIPMPLKFGDLMARAGDVMGLLRTPTITSNGKTPACQEVVWPYFDLTTVPHVWVNHVPTIHDALLIVEQRDGLFVKTVSAVIVDEGHLQLGRIDGLHVGEACAAAIVFGEDPSLVWAAALKLPRYVTPFMVAGWLRSRPVALVSGVSQAIHVPANAEIVFEGVISAGEEGLRFTLSAVTQRKGALFPLGWRSAWSHAAAEQLLLPSVQLVVDGLHDLHLMRDCVVVSLKRDAVTTPQQVILMLWALDMTAYARLVVVVDESVDVRDRVAVRTSVAAHCDPHHDLLRIETGQGCVKLGVSAVGRQSVWNHPTGEPLEEVMRLLSDGVLLDNFC